MIATLVLAACGGSAPSTAAGPEAVTSAAAAREAAAPGSSDASGPGSLQPSEGFAVDEITFTDGERRIRMPVLVADDDELRAVGLMHRTELPADAGMLFVFEEPTSGGFWMKNTLLPLTIAFVGQDGTVQQIMDMDPCTADPCPSYQPDDPYLYAVEANQGYFVTKGISPGSTVALGGRLGGGP